MPDVVHLPLLDSVRIASPCPARWEDMTGDERVRHCAQCDLDVHNLSAMTRVEAEGVLQGLANGRMCARFYRRADGTILTKDCPVGIAAVRRRVLRAASRVAAALGLAVLASAAARASQDTRWGNYGWSMRLNNAPQVQWLAWKANELRYSLFPPKMPAGGWLSGSVALRMPAGDPPPVVGSNGAYGPKEWEFVGQKRASR